MVAGPLHQDILPTLQYDLNNSLAVMVGRSPNEFVYAFKPIGVVDCLMAEQGKDRFNKSHRDQPGDREFPAEFAAPDRFRRGGIFSIVESPSVFFNPSKNIWRWSRDYTQI